MKNRFSRLVMPCALLLMAVWWGPAFAGDVTDSPASGEWGRMTVVGQSANYQLLKEVMSGGAVEGSSASFQMKATVGEWATGPASSPNFRMSQGFWKDLGATYLCGDANGDATINVGDAVHIINYVFKGGPEPNPAGAGDANCDGTINVGDAVHIINYVFKGGAEPCCP